MKVLLSWLHDFAPIAADANDIARALGALGTPVEEMTILGQGLDGVVVARVLRLRKHPDADQSSSSTSTPATAKRCRSAAVRST